MQAEHQLGHDTEVRPGAAKRPEQIGLGFLGGGDDATVRGDQAGLHQVVAAEALLRHEPAHAAAEGEAGDTGVADRSTHHGQPVRRRRRVDSRPGSTAADVCPASLRIDPDAVHP